MPHTTAKSASLVWRRRAAGGGIRSDGTLSVGAIPFPTI